MVPCIHNTWPLNTFKELWNWAMNGVYPFTLPVFFDEIPHDLISKLIWRPLRRGL
jgi:hypothetical protein